VSVARESFGVVVDAPTRTGLPSVATSLIGRDAELERVLALLDEAPIVTITGVGGVGKTRLAIEVAGRVAVSGRRVWFVELADVDRPSEVVGTIADRVGIRAAAPGVPLDTLVARRLAEEPTLLVLDNMEQLVAAAGAVTALAERAPTLRILVTSRTRLRSGGERTLAVRGLALPSTRRSPSRAPSVQLFVDRIGTGPAERDDLDAVAAICAALGGLPLAIELAAAHTRTLGAATVRALIDSDAALGLLDRGPVDAPVRQRSLRGSLEWSYRLLDPDSQRAFRVVGAFSGSFDLDAFRAVAGSSLAGGPMLAAFSALVGHQLVQPAERAMTSDAGTTPARFTMSPPVRELARAFLRDDPECVAITARHTDWFAAVAARVGTLADRAGMREAIAIWRADQPNLMAALRGRFESGDLRGAARISCDLATVWQEQGRYALLREWFATLFAAAAANALADLPPEAHMTAAYSILLDAASAASAEHRHRLDAALDAARDAHDDRALIRGLRFATLSSATHGDIEASRHAADDGRALADRIGEPAAAAEFTMWQAMLAHLVGDIATARALGHDALERARAVGDDRLIVRTSLLLTSLPSPDGVDGDWPSLDALLEMARAAGNVLDELYVLMHLGKRVAIAGDLDRAFALLHEGLVLARRSGARHLELLFLGIVAHSALRAGDDRAAARFHASITPNMAAMRGLSSPGEVERYERRLAERRAVCGAANFDRNVRAASAQSWDDAILEAIQYAARKARRDTSGGLTPRERDVLTELTKGATNKQIGVVLGLTPKTVTHHCAAIYRKLAVQTRAEATAYALQHHLV
jgi:predicted ATPase/DNA-binding CsgD family transcriptional regulator